MTTGTTATGEPSRAPLRAVVADDEPLARALLREMLAAHPEITVVAECADGAAAVDAVLALRPDLLFLDIQMPELDGFGVIGSLEAARMPAVVFVTAYDQFAIRAFEVDAVDYVLKPFDEERLDRTVRRACERARAAASGGGDAGADAERLIALLQRLDPARMRAPASTGAYRPRVVIRVGDRSYFQAVRDIDWLEADGKHVRIHVGKETHVVRDSMQRFEAMLDPETFVRVSRSAIVNVDRVREVQPWFRGDFVLLMKNGAQVTSTRGYRDTLHRLLGRDG